MRNAFTSYLAFLAAAYDICNASRVQLLGQTTGTDAATLGVGSVLMNRYEILGPWRCFECFKWFEKRRRIKLGELNELNVKLSNDEAAEKLEELDMTRAGEGANGAVYRAYDRQDNIHVVIKFINAEVAHRHPEKVEELSHECSITEELQRDNAGDSVGASRLIRCYLNGAETVYHMIVMEDGGYTLYDYLKMLRSRNASISSDWVKQKSEVVKEVMSQVLQGVNYMSNKHVWHRDIKPSNIAVKETEDGTLAARIIDFGFARRQPDVLDENDKMLTANYAAYIYAPPELRRYHKQRMDAQKNHKRFPQIPLMQMLGKRLLMSVHAFDLWSTGVSFLQLICGEGVDKITDYRRTRDILLPALFPENKPPPRQGDLAEHINGVLTRKGCWKVHTYDDYTLNFLTATLNLESGKRLFP
eukprot:TRINITY_DN32518_c0_g1_i1.p1 TRINITY_DN32518_c0_g1~~TRINITY_DN32518_c0_g1_i1.p1  ORF type:complete len:416 (-),score=55.58 TRINITY_DN32518_c0_g1_i1:194-1441(-)